MMINQPRSNHDLRPPSLLIAAHCLTIQRKSKRLDTQELSAILDDLVRELNSQTLSSTSYLNTLNDIVHLLNSKSPPSLLSLSSHYFFILVRNTIQSLLHQLHTTYRLNKQQILVLRNCLILLQGLVDKLHDISKILHWITDATFLDALASCLNNIHKISQGIENKRYVKSIVRLLNLFGDIQERLPIHLHHSLFVRLLEPTTQCLTSSTYVQLFKDLKANSKSLTEIQKLFLIKCPYFLTSYNGPHIGITIEQVLKIMLPRYITILDKHMKTIKHWQRPMMRAIHHLLTTLFFGEGCFTSNTNRQSFQSLINHLLRLINEPVLINKIHSTLINPESLLIDAALIVFSVLIYEPDALDYLKQRKPTLIFRKLTTTSCETIVLNAYMMLAYTMDENDIKGSRGDLSQLLFTTLNLLSEAIASRNQTKNDDNVNQGNIDRNITQLVGTLNGLAQHEHIKNEVSKQNILSFLIESYQKLNGLSKQLLLECLWTLSFNEQAAQQIRQDSQFILSLQNIPKPPVSNAPENTLRRSNSRQNNALYTLNDSPNDGMHKAADGLLWKLVKEPQVKQKKQTLTEKTTARHDQNYKYDIMISYCYNDKDIFYKIQQFLASEGFKIWFDRDNRHGESMETVAEAIDHSAFVISCISDAYRRDNHCQSEIEYAFNSKRFILPLIVRKESKIDGWLGSIMNKNIAVDIGTVDFKIASSLLLKEINQHYKTRLPYVKSRGITPVNGEQILPSSTTFSNDSQSPVRPFSRSTSPAYTSTIIYIQDQIANRSNSRPTTPGSTPAIIYRPDQIANRSNSRPTIPGSTPAIIYRSDQIANRSNSRPTTPGSTPAIIYRPDQISNRSNSRPTTPGSTPAIIGRQDQIANRSNSRPTTPGSTPAIIYRPDQIANRSNSRPTTPGSTPAIIGRQDQIVNRSNSRPTTPGSTPAIIYRPDQIANRSNSRPTTPGSTPAIIGRQDQIVNRSNSRPTTPGSTPAIIYRPDQIANRSNSRPTTPGSTPAIIGRQDQIVNRSNSRPTTPGSTPAIIYRPDQIANRSNSRPTTPGSTPAIIGRQDQIANRSNSRPTTPGSTPAIIGRQDQIANRYNSGPTTSGSTPAIIGRQDQIANRSNSRPTTPGIIPSMIETLPTDVAVQEHLPDEYIHRNTSDSRYRSMPTNTWNKSDVLDFLYDTNLYAMMPLCESMTGGAFIRLFQMCQKKPSSLYDRLNEELHSRFEGLFLPMGTYTQFLIEMDALLGPSFATLLPPPPNTLKRLGNIGQLQPSQPSPISSMYSTVSPHPLQAMTPTDGIQGSRTRIVERAVFRPASIVGRPYNFVVESVQESTALLQQVERYGPQLLLLDQKAGEHRAMNGSH